MTNETIHPATLAALQERVALRIASRLSEQTSQLPHDIGERLRVARERALDRARQVRQAEAAAVVSTSAGAAVLAGPPSLWLRLASALPLLVLVAGLALIERVHLKEQISAAAEIDAALLADALPLAAYEDPGFAAFLKSSAEP